MAAIRLLPALPAEHRHSERQRRISVRIAREGMLINTNRREDGRRSDGRYSRRQEGSGAFGARVQAVIGLTPLTAQVLPGNGSAFRAGSEGSIYAAFGRGCAFPSRRRRGCKGSIPRSGIIKFIARRAIPSPLNPLNLLNPLDSHAGGVSNGDTTTLPPLVLRTTFPPQAVAQ